MSVAVFALVLAWVSGGVAYGLWAGASLPLWLLLAKLHGLYDRDHRALRHLTVDEASSIIIWAISSAAVTLVLSSEIGVGTPGTRSVIRAWAAVVASAFALRATARMLWRRLMPAERALIIGSGPLAEAVRRKIELFPDIHVRIVGGLADCEADELVAWPAWAAGVERIILAAGSIDEELIAALVAFCRSEKVKFSVVPPARGGLGTAVRLNHIADLPVLEYNTWDVSRSTMFLKRVVDVLVAFAALVLLSPLFVAIAIAIALERSGPVFFVQRRAGLDGVPFSMLKFRTMVVDAEERLPELVPLDLLPEPMFKLEHDPRVTRVGRVLRRTSLDELPQLINVFRGDMSLVGPRPEQVELVARYQPGHRFRLAVKPGLTGPMQVFGRGHLTFDERLAVEREYVENISLGRDLRILALTGSTIVRGHGAF